MTKFAIANVAADGSRSFLTAFEPDCLTGSFAAVYSPNIADAALNDRGPALELLRNVEYYTDDNTCLVAI